MLRRFFPAILAFALLFCLISCSGGEEKSKAQESSAQSPPQAASSAQPPAPDPSTETIKERTTGDSTVVEVNAKAPAFAAPLLGGGDARLADFIGNHVVLLEFWSVFCKSCIEEMPHILKLHDKYSMKGLTVLSVNTDFFPEARIAATLRKAGIDLKYPVLRDMNQDIAKDYKVELLPVTVIIDKSGYIRLFQEGYKPGDEGRFEETIEKLLESRKNEDVTLASKGGKTVFAPAGSVLRKEGSLGKAVRLKTLGGTEAVLGGGKSSLLFFWSFYCQPCREELPLVNALSQKYPNVGVYTVNVDSPYLEKKIVKYISSVSDVPCIADWGKDGGPGPLATAFGIGATPSVVILDPKGKIIHSSEGVDDFAAIEAIVQKL